MHRCRHDGLVIDLSGPDGNAFFLIGMARKWAKQLGKDADKIVAEMQSGDYNQLLSVFEREFGNVVTLLNKPGEIDEDICPSCDGDGCIDCDCTGMNPNFVAQL